MSLDTHKSTSVERTSTGGRPESPDLNPIENMWLELKEFIRREVKPTTKSDLIEGIKRFWTSVDVAKCNKYINHLN